MKAKRTQRAVLVAGGLLLALVACDQSEVVAPADSTISLSANPAQVVLNDTGTAQLAPVQILATVRNSIGVPLPGQDVRFTSTAGQLTPPSGLPISTDNLGNAICSLDGALVGPQITATSGKATANITLTASKGLVSTITITNVSSTDLTSCSDTFDITAKAANSSGTGVAGFQIFFEISTQGPTNFTGTFNPISAATDANGEATTTLTIENTTCNSRCVGGLDCTSRIRARDQGSIVVSADVQINDQIP